MNLNSLLASALSSISIIHPRTARCQLVPDSTGSCPPVKSESSRTSLPAAFHHGFGGVSVRTVGVESDPVPIHLSHGRMGGESQQLAGFEIPGTRTWRPCQIGNAGSGR